MFGREVSIPVNWIYPVLKADREMELSDCTQVIQERFQRDYAGMREKQQATVHRNAQYYKPIVSQFEVGRWVWVFDPKIVPGSWDKLKKHWAGPYQIIRKISTALAEVMTVYERGRPRFVSTDVKGILRR